MTTYSIAIQLTPTPTPLTDGYGTTLLMRNPGPAVVYLGGSDVTPGNGFPIEVDEVFGADVPSRAEVYACVAAGTQTVNILRIGC